MEYSHELLDQMQQLTQQLQHEYDMIQKRSKDDPWTAWDQWEESRAEVLRNRLPQDYHVETKGKLINEDWVTSPQIDIIVLYPFYPKYLLKFKLYHTFGVAAVFECKNTLRVRDFSKIVSNSAKISDLLQPSSLEFRDQLRSPILYGVLAHSYELGKDPERKINEQLKKCNQQHISNPRQYIDLLCVANFGTYICTKSLTSHKEWPSGVGVYYWKKDRGKFNLPPVGNFLAEVRFLISKRDTRLDWLSKYFAKVLSMWSWWWECASSNWNRINIDKKWGWLDVEIDYPYF